MTDMSIEVRYVPVASLIPYARNARTHSDSQVAQIAASIREFGFTNPILTDGEQGIIAGHGRLAAAQLLGLASVPTIELGYLSPAQKQAYILADNQLATKAGWDVDLLRVELEDLQSQGFDLAVAGFEPMELQAFLAPPATAGESDPDAVPEPPADPVSVPGDVWILGRHRLVCGDSTDPSVVDKALDGAKPHLMVTDPPYGVEYDANWRNDPVQAGKGARGVPSGRAVGKVLNDDKADWREAWALFPGDVAYVWHAGLYAGTVGESLQVCDFELRSQIVWAKTRFAIGRGHYHWQHEPCWYAVKKGGSGHWNGARDQATVWNIAHTKSETGHSTQKPVECMLRPIENNSKPGDHVYEPFNGSGTTLIACEQSGRTCHAIELNPGYVDVTVKRWQDFTGQTAIREADGAEFNTLTE